jgi:hypothetical protein
MANAARSTQTVRTPREIRRFKGSLYRDSKGLQVQDLKIPFYRKEAGKVKGSPYGHSRPVGLLHLLAFLRA